MVSFLLIVSIFAEMALAGTVYRARFLEFPDGRRELLSEGFSSGRDDNFIEKIREIRYPETILEHKPLGKNEVVELEALTRAPIHRELRVRHVRLSHLPESRVDEVKTLIQNGPIQNRINLVFMGDGYTHSERDLFFDDMERLVKDMFEGPTFHSYLPLFNVHLVFRASNESGIGKNDTPKDTAYGLYRVGNTLRAIMTSKPSAIDQSCSNAPQCDYRIVIANDPYYGGLGGRFAIATRSETTGTVVLRHELGHTFGSVGEEYDGGGYFGANHSDSLTAIKWKHWLSGPLREEPVVARFLDWVWQNLEGAPFTAGFASDGRFSSAIIDFSASGVPNDSDLIPTIDGKPLPFHGTGNMDRFFQIVKLNQGFSAGVHRLRFEAGPNVKSAAMSSLTVHEFGKDYHFEEDFVGAFPVFNQSLSDEGYRPTHGTCLMREMPSRRFCSVCQENNWLKFFAKVALIDDVRVEIEESHASVKAEIIKLGQLRVGGALNEREELEIRWYRDGLEILALSGKLEWSMPVVESLGNWELRVTYHTPEVRKDTAKLLSAKKAFSI